jgi:hypothetical protein
MFEEGLTQVQQIPIHVVPAQDPQQPIIYTTHDSSMLDPFSYYQGNLAIDPNQMLQMQQLGGQQTIHIKHNQRGHGLSFDELDSSSLLDIPSSNYR